MAISAFIFFILLFFVIGIWSLKEHKNTTNDYLLAGRSISSFNAAISAAATSCSGFMFIGLIGFAYANGLSALWFIFSRVVGDLMVTLWVYPRLYKKSVENNNMTFSSVLSSWFGKDMKLIRVVSALVIIVFLSVYISTQFSAGGKALYAVFGFDYKMGVVIGAAIILAYCFAGGIRASIWTDVAQFIIMLAAMIILLFSMSYNIGGLDNSIAMLKKIDSGDYLNIWHHKPAYNIVLFIVGFLFNGVSVLGQPQIVIRIMTIKSKDVIKTQLICVTSILIFGILAIAVGIGTRLFFDNINFDQELALPLIAKNILPGWLTGIVLAGIFASVISTADSQILSCSAALTEDLINKDSYLLSKISTLIITLTTLLMALKESSSIFKLTIFAWSALGSTFAPIIVLYSLGYKISQKVTLLMMFSAITTIIIWHNLGLNYITYSALPACIVPLLIFSTSSVLEKIKNYKS